MFRIAICDDERHFRKRIHDILIEYMNENDILYEIDEFESGKDFISLGINLAKYDIVFLDVNMDELDGMETAQKIFFFTFFTNDKASSKPSILFKVQINLLL